MKQLILLIVVLFLAGISVSTAYGQCSGGQINGIFYTSCFPHSTALSDGTITIPNTAANTTTVTVNNDTPRLQRAITASLGRLVFNEADYYINNELTIYSYR